MITTKLKLISQLLFFWQFQLISLITNEAFNFQGRFYGQFDIVDIEIKKL